MNYGREEWWVYVPAQDGKEKSDSRNEIKNGGSKCCWYQGQSHEVKVLE